MAGGVLYNKGGGWRFLVLAVLLLFVLLLFELLGLLKVESNGGGSVVSLLSFFLMFYCAFLKMILFLIAAAVGLLSPAPPTGLTSVYGDNSNFPSLPNSTLVMRNSPFTFISLMKSWNSSSRAFSYLPRSFMLLNRSLFADLSLWLLYMLLCVVVCLMLAP